MLIDERTIRQETLLHAAQLIMAAARTAPKSRGVDILEIQLLTDDDKTKLASQMHVLHKENNLSFFERDAQNILDAGAVILFATINKPLNLDCGYCGYPNCKARPNNVPCAFNSTDLGVAIGSAAATASNLRIDNRIMYSAGKAALSLGLFPNCNQCFALPLSIGSKNIFVDRKFPKK